MWKASTSALGIFVRLRGTRKHLAPVCGNLENSLMEFVDNKLVDKYVVLFSMVLVALS